MGTLRYGHPEHVCVIDDRLLVHLQIVIIDKLRHGEHFAFSYEVGDSGAATTLWMSPSIPVRFDFLESAGSEINRDWVHALARASMTADGLHVLEEPVTRPVPLRAMPTGPSVQELAPARR